MQIMIMIMMMIKELMIILIGLLHDERGVLINCLIILGNMVMIITDHDYVYDNDNDCFAKL